MTKTTLKSPQWTRKLWNGTAGKSACICFHPANGWFSRIVRFKCCQCLLLLWNSLCQLLTLGFILEIMKRWGLLLPAGIGSDLSDQEKKWCWQNERRFYSTQMEQQKAGILFYYFFPALFLIPADVSFVLGGWGAAEGWGCSAQGEFAELEQGPAGRAAESGITLYLLWGWEFQRIPAGIIMGKN